MSITGIIIGIVILVILCLTAYTIYSKWRQFKDLRPGDTCASFEKTNDDTYDLKLEKIIKIDKDTNDYTSKIYTKNKSYTLLDCIRDNVYLICND